MLRSFVAFVLLGLAGPALLGAQDPPEAPRVVPVTEPSPEDSPEPSPQEPPRVPDGPAPPTFTAEVEQVIVDLVVTDKKDNPVPGISRDDLVIEEDGVPQEIVSFEAVELPDTPAEEPPPLPVVSRNTDEVGDRGRTFVIVFDDMNMSPFRAHEAKGAVASFLQGAVREGDYVTLIATSGAAWWTSRMEAGREQLIDTLKRLDGRKIPDHSQERMTDWEAMRIHLNHDPQVVGQVMRRWEKYGVTMLAQRDRNDPLAGTADDPYVTARASSQYFEARTRIRVALEVLERAVNGLAGTRGRKSVILLSGGFIYDSSVDEFKRVREASRRANAAIYFVNARGVEGLSVELSAEFGPAPPVQDVGLVFASMNRVDDGSESLAVDTGGFVVRNTNDLAKGIERIARETQLYYLAGYVPTNTARDGGYREIQVKFKKGRGDGLEIRARKGYFAPTASGEQVMTAKEGIDPVLQAALDSPWPKDEIPLRMTHYVTDEQMLGKMAVLVLTEVDIRDLQFEEMDGRLAGEIQFLLVVAQRETGEFFRYDQVITMRLRPSTHERLEQVWFPIARDFELGPGDHQAKIIVREKATGHIGTVVHEFKVPDPAEFRVSTPILSDTQVPTVDESDPKPQPVARREFPQNRQFLCGFEVYGAAKDQGTGMPRVTQGYQILAADGSVLLGIEPTPMQPTSLGALSRLFGFPLKEVPLGEYELVMTVRDEIAGKALERREPFTVVEPVPEPAPETTATHRTPASP